MRYKILAAFSWLFFSSFLFAAEPPPINVAPSPEVWLQTGNSNDAYLVEDNRWGQGSITDFDQRVGVSYQIGPLGEVAFRTSWRWPDGENEVKAYPAVLYGRKPGYYSANNLMNGFPILLPDGMYSQIAPTGHTAGTFLPMQLPVKSLNTKFAVKNNAVPTGRGHLTYDIWLQSEPQQTSGFWKSSITHEIMIPVQQWGGYGAHGERNPGWYDHDVILGGLLYHVYATKQLDGQLLYNFGSLSGAYGRTGWKMIAFVPAVLPINAAQIDLAAIINHVATRVDSAGNRWANGNEWVSSVEFGMEPSYGTGDITVYDYKVWQGEITVPTDPVPLPPPTEPVPPPPPPPTCAADAWKNGRSYVTGNIVSYNGVMYIATAPNKNKRPSDTRFWSRYYC